MPMPLGLALVASSAGVVQITLPRRRTGSAMWGTPSANTKSVPTGNGLSVAMKVPPREMFLV